MMDELSNTGLPAHSKSPKFGLCVAYPAPGIVERIGMDWDWLWIDGQHGELAYADILALVRACDLIQRPSFVRVPEKDPGTIGRYLDTGASAIIVPQVESPDEAHTLVQAAKFPPMGRRSYGGRRIIDRNGRGYSETANSTQQLFLQVESPAAVKKADLLAAEEGVDGLFLGPDDYMLCTGHPMDQPIPIESIAPAMECVAAACARKRKKSIMIGMNAELLEHCLQLEFDYIVGGADARFLAESSLKHSKTMRAFASEFSANQVKTNL